MAKKLERQKMFLENLKKIEVEKPGFESSHARFAHYESARDSPIKEKEKRASSNREQELRIREENERMRSVMIESNRSQLEEKKGSGVFGKQERFKEARRGAPGVGSYSNEARWEKKSHNVKYQKK